MAKEIVKRNCVLRVNNDVMSIIEPSGFTAMVNLEITGDYKLLYSTKIKDTLFTAESPIDLLDYVSVKYGKDNNPSNDYVSGYWDGVAFGNKEQSKNSFDEGYKKAIGDAIGVLISKVKNPLEVPEVQKLQSATYDGPETD